MASRTKFHRELPKLVFRFTTNCQYSVMGPKKCDSGLQQLAIKKETAYTPYISNSEPGQSNRSLIGAKSPGSENSN
jgi:hypothetical protein